MHKISKKINLNELIFAVVMLLFSGTAFVMAIGYSDTGRAFPLIVIVLLIAMLILKILSIFNPEIAKRVDIRGIELPAQSIACDGAADQERPEDQAVVDIVKWPQELMMIFWLAFLLVSIYLLGFLYTIPVFLVSFLKFQGKHSWLVSAIVSVAVLAFVYVLFGIVLSLEFPQGVIISG